MTAVNTGPMTQYVSGKPIMVDFDAGGSSYAAGDVIVKGAVPLVTHEAIPAFTGGSTRDAVSSGGGIYQCPTDGSPVVGEDVYWDATNKKLSAVPLGVHFGVLLTGPTFLASGASPTTDGDLGLALHRPRGGGVATVAAAGTQQSNATALTAEVNVVTGSNGSAGVYLPAPVPGARVTVINTVGATANTLKVYPGPNAGGGQYAINNLSANAAQALVANGTAIYYAENSTNWASTQAS